MLGLLNEAALVSCLWYDFGLRARTVSVCLAPSSVFPFLACCVDLCRDLWRDVPFFCKMHERQMKRVSRSNAPLATCVISAWVESLRPLAEINWLRIRPFLVVVNVVEWQQCKGWCKAFGFPPDTLRGAMAAVRKRQSMTSSTTTAAGGTSAVPRSTSQPGNFICAAVVWRNCFQFCVMRVGEEFLFFMCWSFILTVLDCDF